MNDVDKARLRWLAERATYEEFGKKASAELSDAVKDAGIAHTSSSRAKETHSLVKKLLKGKHTYDSMPDKVGIRCVVRYRGDLDEVLEIAQRLFVCSDIDRKHEQLGIERLGYVSIHARICFPDHHPYIIQYPSLTFCAELQVRTLAQHLWSEMSHDAVYKNDSALVKLPDDLLRRVNLMAGLIEVADREFDRLNQEIPVDSSAQLYKALERQYYKLAATRPDTGLSLEIINLVSPMYASKAHEIIDRLDQFYSEHEQTLKAVYNDANESNSSSLLFQPEALMLYERLEADPLETRRVWNTRFPETELERLANTFGISFD